MTQSVCNTLFTKQRVILHVHVTLKCHILRCCGARCIWKGHCETCKSHFYMTIIYYFLKKLWILQYKVTMSSEKVQNSKFFRSPNHLKCIYFKQLQSCNNILWFDRLKHSIYYKPKFVNMQWTFVQFKQWLQRSLLINSNNKSSNHHLFIFYSVYLFIYLFFANAQLVIIVLWDGI